METTTNTQEDKKLVDIDLAIAAMCIAFDAGKWYGQVELEEHFDNTQFAQSVITSIESKSKCLSPSANKGDIGERMERPVTINLRSQKWRDGVKKSTNECFKDAIKLLKKSAK